MRETVKQILEAEGIKFENGRVDLKKYQWKQVTLDMFEQL